MTNKDIEQVPDEFSDQDRTGCVWTYAECVDCPFEMCWKDGKRLAISRERHELMRTLYAKLWKPRAIASVLGASPSTVWDVIRATRRPRPAGQSKPQR